ATGTSRRAPRCWTASVARVAVRTVTEAARRDPPHPTSIETAAIEARAGRNATAPSIAAGHERCLNQPLEGCRTPPAHGRFPGMLRAAVLAAVTALAAAPAAGAWTTLTSGVQITVIPSLLLTQSG